jgi:HEAT repeat protein
MLVSIFHDTLSPLREEAVRALVDVKKDSRTLKVLIAACGAPEKNIRLHALRALANSKNDLAIPAVKLASLDTDEDIQYEAKRSLASIQKLTPSERRKHKEEEEEPQNDPRRAATFHSSYIDTLTDSIRNIGTTQEPLLPKAPKNLEQAWIDDLKSANPESRIVAAKGLGYTKKNKAAAEALIKAAKDPDVHVRLAVIEALGKIGYRKSMAVLKLATQDSNSEIRSAAKKSLAIFQ